MANINERVLGYFSSNLSSKIVPEEELKERIQNGIHFSVDKDIDTYLYEMSFEDTGASMFQFGILLGCLEVVNFRKKVAFISVNHGNRIIHRSLRNKKDVDDFLKKLCSTSIDEDLKISCISVKKSWFEDLGIEERVRIMTNILMLLLVLKDSVSYSENYGSGKLAISVCGMAHIVCELLSQTEKELARSSKCPHNWMMVTNTLALFVKKVMSIDGDFKAYDYYFTSSNNEKLRFSFANDKLEYGWLKSEVQLIGYLSHLVLSSYIKYGFNGFSLLDKDGNEV